MRMRAARPAYAVNLSLRHRRAFVPAMTLRTHDLTLYIAKFSQNNRISAMQARVGKDARETYRSPVRWRGIFLLDLKQVGGCQLLAHDRRSAATALTVAIWWQPDQSAIAADRELLTPNRRCRVRLPPNSIGAAGTQPFFAMRYCDDLSTNCRIFSTRQPLRGRIGIKPLPPGQALPRKAGLRGKG